MGLAQCVNIFFQGASLECKRHTIQYAWKASVIVWVVQFKAPAPPLVTGSSVSGLRKPVESSAKWHNFRVVSPFSIPVMLGSLITIRVNLSTIARNSMGGRGQPCAVPYSAMKVHGTNHIWSLETNWVARARLRCANMRVRIL
eukprot:6212074-Pleurochrysis_carterae.AAC.2